MNAATAALQLRHPVGALQAGRVVAIMENPSQNALIAVLTGVVHTPGRMNTLRTATSGKGSGALLSAEQGMRRVVSSPGTSASLRCAGVVSSPKYFFRDSSSSGCLSRSDRTTHSAHVEPKTTQENRGPVKSRCVTGPATH